MISLCLAVMFSPLILADLPVIRIGSKNFTESYILAEILAQKIEATGMAKVERRMALGGTGIVHTALEAGEIDIYPEYTGTLNLAILGSQKKRNLSELREAVSGRGLLISDPLGINNSYALAMRREISRTKGITRISNLRKHPDLRFAFSYEFMERNDGYRALLKHYKWKPSLPPTRMDHALVYASIAENKADVIEVYSTDSKISKLDLVVLEDDLRFFPDYEGVFLYRRDVLERWPDLAKILASLGQSLNNTEMIHLNGLVEIEKASYSSAARQFLSQDNSIEGPQYPSILWRQTKRHLLLVFVPTIISVLIGLPLGILATKFSRLGQLVLAVSGLIQTVPSLALLCFLIPVFGIGLAPALVALVLYGLLPIVRSTYGGLTSIEKRHLEVARVLGLSWWQTLIRIQIPLAAIHIFGGIKTAAIINVGLATLAAFIGAGGYGALIVTGLSLNNNTIILQGALPAATMALAMHFAFEALDKLFIPKGLKL